MFVRDAACDCLARQEVFKLIRSMVCMGGTLVWPEPYLGLGCNSEAEHSSLFGHRVMTSPNKCCRCDFTPIYEYHMAERERKKNLSKEVRRCFVPCSPRPSITRLRCPPLLSRVPWCAQGGPLREAGSAP